VSVAYDGKRTYACGGFGADIDEVFGEQSVNVQRGIGQRCQNVAIGRVRDDGSQVFYIAHHGDSWVQTPFFATYAIDDQGTLEEIENAGHPDTLFEGLAWQDDVLYVTTHTTGLNIYTTEPSGLAIPASQLGGFVNAIEVTVQGQYAYVADGAGGIKVVDVANPLAPAIVASFATTSLARHVDVDGDRLYVAMGSDGILVLDVTNPLAPTQVGRIAVTGSAQAVDAEGPLLASANWSHAAVYDTATLQLLATEEVAPYPSFEQDLAIALSGEQVFVGEWQGVHRLEYLPGVTSPDILVSEEIVSFTPEASDDRVVVVENRGQQPLIVSSIVSEQPLRFPVTAGLPVTLDPGDRMAFEIGYRPPAPVQGSSIVRLFTSDPDLGQSVYQLPAVAQENQQINEGDPVGSEFNFLDPGDDVNALRGNVVVLAYFALF